LLANTVKTIIFHNYFIVNKHLNNFRNLLINYLNLFVLPGNFLVLNDAFVIIDLETGVLQELLLTGVPTDDTLGDCPPS